MIVHFARKPNVGGIPAIIDSTVRMSHGLILFLEFSEISFILIKYSAHIVSTVLDQYKRLNRARVFSLLVEAINIHLMLNTEEYPIISRIFFLFI
jgi:hypothetical protein